MPPPRSRALPGPRHPPFRLHPRPTPVAQLREQSIFDGLTSHKVRMKARVDMLSVLGAHVAVSLRLHVRAKPLSPSGVFVDGNREDDGDPSRWGSEAEGFVTVLLGFIGKGPWEGSEGGVEGVPRRGREGEVGGKEGGEGAAGDVFGMAGWENGEEEGANEGRKRAAEEEGQVGGGDGGGRRARERRGGSSLRARRFLAGLANGCVEEVPGLVLGEARARTVGLSFFKKGGVAGGAEGGVAEVGRRGRGCGLAGQVQGGWAWVRSMGR
ncbi:hypothetical protein Naga_100547g1, partial [Nannochloropsis gaditana]